MKKFISIILLCTSVLCACDKAPISASFFDVGDTLRLEKGMTYQLQVTLYPESSKGTIEYVTDSSKPIVTLDEQGLISAVGIGTASVSAYVKSNTDISAKVIVVVEPAPDEYYKPYYYGEKYVDLGLPVIWCATNVGADKMEGYGAQFSWGETTPYSSNRTYKFKKENNYISYTKYTTEDGLRTLEKEDDVVAAYDEWARTPTKEEWEMLYNTCRRYSTDYNGVSGLVFTGNNGHQIFLPDPVNKCDCPWFGKDWQLVAYASSSVCVKCPEHPIQDCFCCFTFTTKGYYEPDPMAPKARVFPYYFRGVASPI